MSTLPEVPPGLATTNAAPALGATLRLATTPSTKARPVTTVAEPVTVTIPLIQSRFFSKMFSSRAKLYPR